MASILSEKWSMSSLAAGFSPKAKTKSVPKKGQMTVKQFTQRTSDL